MIGESAGLTLVSVGGAGRLAGRLRAEAAMAAWTSCAAASMSRSSENSRLREVLPWRLLEFIAVRPAMVEKRRSSGVATVAAIVSGLAPGSDAVTWMVGKSTVGRSATGSLK